MIDKSTVARMSVADVKGGLETGNVQVVDVRPSFDFAGGRIPGSVSLRDRSFTNRAKHLDKSRRLLFVSEHESEGETAARIAISVGFVNVANTRWNEVTTAVAVRPRATAKGRQHAYLLKEGNQ